VRNINARVPGLVSLFELITDGKAPDTLAGLVQGTIDYEKFVSYAKREYIQLDFDVPTGVGDYRADTGPATGIAPAAREAWIVTDYSIKVTLPVGRILTLAPTMWRPTSVSGAAGNTSLPHQVGDSQSSIATEVGGTGLRFLWVHATELPRLALPGTEFGYSIQDWAGSGSGTLVNAYVGFYRFRL